MSEPDTAGPLLWFGLRSGAFVAVVAGAHCVLEPEDGRWLWEVRDGDRIERGIADTREEAARDAVRATTRGP